MRLRSPENKEVILTDDQERVALTEQLKDRKAMRQTLIHRIECAVKRGSKRAKEFEMELKDVEFEIRSLKGEGAVSQ